MGEWGCVGVHWSGGAHAGRGAVTDSANELLLLSGIESLSLPVDRTREQLTSWWYKQAELHTHTHRQTDTHTLVKDRVNFQ